jgi:hypothetical protein
MARMRLMPFGAIIEFDHTEVVNISNVLNNFVYGTGAVSALLTAIGTITGPGLIIAGAVAAFFSLGQRSLTNCNANRNGISLYVCPAGPFWCKPR